MKAPWLLIAMGLSAYMANAKADDVKCLSEVMYGEARGESVAGAVAIGQATKNRANHQYSDICHVEGVHKRQPEKSLVAYYQALAKAVLFDKFPAVVKKSDSWNAGTKPQQAGKVERVIDNHVFYVATPIAEKKHD